MGTYSCSIKVILEKNAKMFKEGQDDGNHSSSVKDHYRILYFEDFNFAISSIKEHFDQPGYVLYQNLKDLLLKAAKQ